MAKKLIFIIPEDWFFLSHFAERAQAAVNAGYEVVLVTPLNPDTPKIEMVGLRVIPWRFQRRSINPLAALRSFWHLFRIFKLENPDLIYTVALKPILLNGLAMRLARVKNSVTAPVGLGYLFMAKGLKAQILRPVVIALLKATLNPKGSRVIFENPDNRAEFVRRGLVRPSEARLIRGSGVNVAAFAPVPPPSEPPHFICVARMLHEKGITNFIEAARHIKHSHPHWRFTLVGASDSGNHGAIALEQLQNWHVEGHVQWLGKRHDIAALLNSAHVYVLPSYGEGLPKSSLEAMACGLPVITTDAPGCRETVIHGHNGLLVPVNDTMGLANAMITLGKDAKLRQNYGSNSRQMAVEQFSSETVIAETLAVWAELCPPSP